MVYFIIHSLKSTCETDAEERKNINSLTTSTSNSQQIWQCQKFGSDTPSRMTFGILDIQTRSYFLTFFQLCVQSKYSKLKFNFDFK